MNARTDRTIGAVLLAISAFWAWQTSLLEDPGIDGTIGPRVFPWLLSGLLAALAIFLIAATFGNGARRRRVSGTGSAEIAVTAETATARTGSQRPSLLRTEWGGVSITMAILLIYVSSLKYLGFLLATPVLMLITIKYLMGERSWVRTLAVSIGVSVVVWYLFGKIFSVPLPNGRILG